MPQMVEEFNSSIEDIESFIGTLQQDKERDDFRKQLNVLKVADLRYNYKCLPFCRYSRNTCLD